MKTILELRRIYLVGVIVFSLLGGATLAHADVCPYDEDFQFILKKAISSYLSDPSSAAVTHDEVNNLIEFYFGTPDTATADCSTISGLISKVDAKIPAGVIPSPSKRWSVKHCATCADGTSCGGKNSRDQRCSCMDMNGDGRYEICHLSPVMPPNDHCTECWDGTVCDEKNPGGLKCNCIDVDGDNQYELCFLRPVPPGPIPPGPGPTPTCTPPAACKSKCDNNTEFDVGALDCAATETCCLPMPQCPGTCKTSCSGTEVQMPAACTNASDICCMSLPGPIPPGPGPTPPGPAPSPCSSCYDGTSCGDTNAEGLLCYCEDSNGDGEYDVCSLGPGVPPPAYQ